jgi:hypothetical protein
LATGTGILKYGKTLRVGTGMVHRLTWAAAAFPSVIGGPEWDFTFSAYIARCVAAHSVSARGALCGVAPVGSWRGSPSTCECGAKENTDHC